jgi:methionine-rich copper-binding protein CopC
MKKFLILSILTPMLSFALAHSSLETSTPADGSVLSEAPAEIILEFKESIEANFSIFKVYAIPADMLTDAGMSSEASEHSAESEEHSAEGEEHSEGDNHAGDESHAEGEEHSEEGAEDEHNEGGAHGVMDAAASVFVPTVIDLSGDEAERADAAILAEGTTKNVTISLKDDLAPGAYVVMFRVLSSDTHTIEGFITFEIAAH